MKLKQTIASIASVACMLSSVSYVYAQETFDSAISLISDVIDVSIKDISASSKATAKAETLSKITTDGTKVSFDGTTIGYWSSTSDSTLYADAAMTTPLIEEDINGYVVDPSLLKTILDDLNSNIVENYSPSSGDWSKIIGTYDITLGNVTIPASQWITVTPSTTTNPLADGKAVNISALSGINNTNATDCCTTNDVSIMTWLIDSTGKLYISSLLADVCLNNDTYWYYGIELLENIDLNFSKYSSGTAIRSTTCSQIKVGLLGTDNINGLGVALYMTDLTNTVVGTVNLSDTKYRSLYSVTDPSDKYTGTISAAKSCGVAYLTGSQYGVTSLSEYQSKHEAMFTSNSCNKRVTGNTTLSKRLAKIATLTASDSLIVSNSGWFVNDTDTSLDSYVTTQTLSVAGSDAIMGSDVEVEPLSFKVVAPTTLPLYLSSDGTVTAATNASISNKSNAPVKITGVSIAANAECGWTLVNSSPSGNRGDNEFTFTVNINEDTVISRGGELPFTYSAQLSPVEQGTETINLATVSVTIDWAEE